MTLRSRNRFLVFSALVSALALGSGCTAQTGGDESSAAVVFSDEAVSATVSALPQESVATMPAARLAEGLIPPTNRWFSGLVFGDPQPVFPLPLSFALTDTGFEFGVPLVDTSANTIAATPSVDVGAILPTVRASRVTAYDDASVTIQLLDDDDSAVGDVRISEGSPIVSFTPAAPGTLTLTTAPEPTAAAGVYATDVAGQAYGMITDGVVDGAEMTVERGESVTWFAVASGSGVLDLVASAHAVAGVSLNYSATDDSATTTLSYDTAGSNDTLIAVLPHQYETMAAPAPSACELGTYDTVYGTMHLCAGRQLSWTAPAVLQSDAVSLDAVDDSVTAEIRTQLRVDAELPAELPDDSYFGGKALYRLANLLQVAKQVGDTRSAASVRERLASALIDWTTVDRCETATTRCFVYDTEAKGLVAKVSSFGSEEFNDHHFHYGYLLYAAAVAVADDPTLAGRVSPVMDLVAADIAADGAGSYFPDQRVFDAYAGHSWASGYSPFRDGNNQESSSEAVNAWNGLALWAEVSDNAALSVEARWMLANEAATAKAYWTDFDDSDPVYDGYGHSVIALNWGAKRDYSTWFSAEPNAMLGIQLIPMSPASGYLSTDPARITTNLEQASAAGYEVQFGDYMLMYAALRSTEAAQEAYAQAQASPAMTIDDANSRTYLLAFLASAAG